MVPWQAKQGSVVIFAAKRKKEAVVTKINTHLQ
jgi:hypothetical protein